jgi:hypothetical protein
MSDHDHTWTIVERIAHAPITDYDHTAVIVLRCDCGLWSVFPPQNYLMTSRAFKRTLSQRYGGTPATSRPWKILEDV